MSFQTRQFIITFIVTTFVLRHSFSVLFQAQHSYSTSPSLNGDSAAWHAIHDSTWIYCCRHASMWLLMTSRHVNARRVHCTAQLRDCSSSNHSHCVTLSVIRCCIWLWNKLFIKCYEARGLFEDATLYSRYFTANTWPALKCLLLFFLPFLSRTDGDINQVYRRYVYVCCQRRVD